MVFVSIRDLSNSVGVGVKSILLLLFCSLHSRVSTKSSFWEPKIHIMNLPFVSSLSPSTRDATCGKHLSSNAAAVARASHYRRPFL